MSDLSETSNKDQERDKVIQVIQSELENHKKEHERLKDHLLKIIDENKKLQKKVIESKSINTNCRNEGQLVEKLKAQVKNLTQEKESFEELWHTSQRTIATLETEVGHYRRQLSQPNSVYSLKQEYLKNLKEMESRMKELSGKLEKKTQENEMVNRGKIEAETKFNALESKFNEIITQKKLIIEKCMATEVALAKAKSHISFMEKEKQNIARELEKANNLVQQHQIRKTEAVAKVHEAVALAETAIAEKEASLVREKDVREECNYLAKTIGQVMEEAAKKVDDEFEQMRKDHQMEVDKLLQIISKNKAQIDQQTKRLKENEIIKNDLEQKVSELSKSNMLLDNDLHRASQTIVDLELRLQTLEKGIKKEQEHSREMAEKSRQLQEIIDENKKMKVQWKQMTLDVTSKLQNKIKDLYNRIRKLENENLRLQALTSTEIL